MIWQKITYGYVNQRFDDKKCIAMHFTAGDEVICENFNNSLKEGTLINQPEHDYQPFNMELTGKIIVLIGNVIDGLTIYGPFEDMEAASSWTEKLDVDYVITDFYRPD